MAYGMAKAALEHLTVSLAEQLRPHGIPVNTFRIDVPVASEGFVAAHARRRPLRLGAARGRGRGDPLDARPARRRTPGHNAGMARLRAEHGIMRVAGRSAAGTRSTPTWSRSHPPREHLQVPPRLATQPRLTGPRPRSPVAASRPSTTAPRSSMWSSASLWWTVALPRARAGRGPALRPGQGARQAFYREDPGRPDDHAPPPLPHQWRRAPRARALGDDATRTTSPTTAARSPGCCSTRPSSSAGADRAERLETGLRRAKVHVGKPARLGPDGRWHYEWDERLRLGRDRALTVHWGTRRDDDGHPHVTRARFRDTAHRRRHPRPHPRARHLVRRPA